METFAGDEEQSREEILQQRMNYYRQYDNHIVPWYYLAAIDQYERNIQDARNDIPKREGIVAIQFSDEYWSGELNPQVNDTSPIAINYFGDVGLDGEGDGLANIKDDTDVLFSMVSFLGKYELSENDFKLALWDYYKNETAIN